MFSALPLGLFNLLPQLLLETSALTADLEFKELQTWATHFDVFFCELEQFFRLGEGLRAQDADWMLFYVFDC